MIVYSYYSLLLVNLTTITRIAEYGEFVGYETMQRYLIHEIFSDDKPRVIQFQYRLFHDTEKTLPTLLLTDHSHFITVLSTVIFEQSHEATEI